MGELAMAALARGGQLSVQVAPLRLDLALAHRHLPALFAFPNLPPLVVVRRVIGPPLTIQVALQAPQRFGIRSDLRAKRLEHSLRFRDHRDRAGAKIQSHAALTQAVLRFLVGLACTDHLGVEAVAFPEFAPHETNVLHRARQSMDLDRITHIELRGQDQPGPFNPIAAPANPARIGFAFDRIHLLLALKPDTFGATQQQPIRSAIGARRQFLDGEAIEVAAQPTCTKLFRIRVQRVCRIEMLGAGLGEEDFALGIVSREDSGALERFRLADQAPPLPRLAQAGIVDLAGRFEPGQQGAFLGMADP